MKPSNWCALALLLVSMCVAGAAETVRVELKELKPGQLQTIVWHGLPVGIYHRTEHDIKLLRSASLTEYVDPLDEKVFDSLRLEHRLKGNEVSQLYSQQTVAVAGGPLRSLKPQYFVFVNLSTAFGCALHFRPQTGAPSYFHDPCHDVRFDMAGRIYDNGASYWRNLFIPPHRFIQDGSLLLGESESPPFTVRLHPDFTQFDVANPETAILAARWRNWSVLQQSLSASVRLNGLARIDYPALGNIIKDAPLSLLQRAVRSGLDVNAVSPTGAVPLVMLLWSADTERMRILLDAGANPNGVSGTTGERKTPLHFYFDIQEQARPVTEMVQLLLARGADPNWRYQGESPCSLAAKTPDAILKAAFANVCQRR